MLSYHDDVIKWKHFPRNWPFVRGIHRSPVNSPHKGQWRGALMFSLICVWINGWVNNREAGDLRRYRAHFDVTVMLVIVYTELCFSLYESLSIQTNLWGKACIHLLLYITMLYIFAVVLYLQTIFKRLYLYYIYLNAIYFVKSVVFRARS